MRYRTTLTDKLGNSVIISEPEGLISAILGLTRHPDWHSLVKEFKTSLRLYGSNGTENGYRDWVKNVELRDGPDAVIKTYFEAAEDNFTFTEMHDGEVGIQTIIEALDFDHALEFTPVQKGMWRNLVSRWETPVDVQSPTNLDGDSIAVLDPLVINLPPQPINKLSSFTGRTGDYTTAENCYLATTGNITLSGHQTIDTVLTTEQMRIAVKSQSDPKENGLYNATAGAWTRTLDSNTGTELENLVVTVTNGSVNAGKSYRQTTTSITIGASNIVFIETNFVDFSEVWAASGTQGPGTTPVSVPGIIRYAHLSITKVNDDIIDTFDLPNAAIMPGGIPAGLNNTPADVNDVLPSLELGEPGGLLEITCNADFLFYFSARFQLFSGGHQGVKSVTATVNIYVDVNGSQSLITSVSNTVLSGVPIIPNGDFAWRSFSDLQVPISTSSSYSYTASQADIVKFYAEYIFTYDYYPSTGTNDLFYDDPSAPHGAGQIINGGLFNVDLQFKLKSVRPDTTTQGFLTHDFIAAIIHRIVGTNSFYSPYVGGQNTKYRVYFNDGPFWNNVNMKIIHIRGYLLSQKILSASMKDVWDGLNPMFNTGLGYTTLSSDQESPGQEVIEIDKKSAFYDDSEMSVLLSGVQRIRRSYGPDYINACETGFQSGKIGDGNISNAIGLDDPQKQTRVSILKNIGRKLSLLTTWIAQGLTIETAIRTNVIKNTDYQFDDNIAIIEVTKTGPIYSARLDEDFSSVTGIQDEGQRYNKHHTPERFFVRWLNYVSMGLQSYLGTVFRFTGGEGNYNMSSTMIPGSAPDDYAGPLAGNSDIPVSTDYLYNPKLFEIDHYLTLKEFNTIDSKRKFAIGVSQTDGNHQAFFITDLQFELMSGQIKLKGYFKNEFNIVNVGQGGTITQGGRTWDATFDYTFGDV